jgi:hypothetical protein
VKAGIGTQRFAAQHQHVVAGRVQLHRLARVVVAQQQVAAALDQLQHGVVHVQRHQAAVERAEAFFQRSEPLRHESQRQRVRHGQVDRRLRGHAPVAQQRAHAVDLAQHLQRLLVEHVAGRRQAGGEGGAVDQVRAEPVFQRLDAARERRLRHVAQLRRAAEVVGLHQGDEVFQPLGFHAVARGCDRAGIVAVAPNEVAGQWSSPCQGAWHQDIVGRRSFACSPQM